MIFKKIKEMFSTKIEVIVRHCHFSDISAHKNRLSGFSRKKCHDNLLATLDPKKVNLTFLLDTYHPSTTPHFVLQQTKYPVVEIKEGTETGSFLYLLSYVESLKLSPQTIVYFLEDDYLHREEWVDVLMEGFSIPEAHYVTLFDHRDKYFHPNYSQLQSKIFHTEHCHWRTTPSTTNTYAMRWGTLKQDMEMHRQFSEGRKISADHEKFLALGAQGKNLISSIPGWSTHVEEEFLSPCTDWKQVLSLF